MKNSTDIEQQTPSFDEKIGRRVIVKFEEDSFQPPYEDQAEKHLEGEWKERWEKLSGDFPEIHLNRLFVSVEPARIQELSKHAVEIDSSYKPVNFLSFFDIDLQPGVDPYMLAEVLNAWEIVEYAYVESAPAPPPGQPTGANPNLSAQRYLDAPQVGIASANDIGGINARYAWNLEQPPGVGIGAGRNISFVDVEKGWKLDHEDLAAANISLLSGINGIDKEEIKHGTSVLGVLAAQDNGSGCVGIAYQATGKVASGWIVANSLLNWPDAIMSASSALTYGDVMLLEAQIQPAGIKLPLELESANFKLIRQATALGITVVEAAGNGSVLLDTQVDNNSKQILNPNSSDFTDSGAILVGAAHPAGNKKAKRWLTSNYGGRVNCFAWGSQVVTTDIDDHGNSTYTNNFTATSSASAIVAGAAIVVQGIAKAKNLGGNPHHTYSPAILRDILGDLNYGTPSDNPLIDQIGVMPNLKKIIDDKMGLGQNVRSGGNRGGSCALFTNWIFPFVKKVGSSLAESLRSPIRGHRH